MHFGNESISDLISGVAGSLLALIFLKPPVVQLVGYMAGGILTSYYLTPIFAEMLSAPVSTTGFVVGLFSMAVLAKIFHMLEALDVKDLLGRLLKKIGLP